VKKCRPTSKDIRLMYSHSEINKTTKRQRQLPQRFAAAAASIWFEIWEDRGSGSTKFRLFFQANFREISIFSGNFTKNFDFSRQIFEKFRFFHAIFETFRFSRQKLLIYSYFWPDYSISLQKSPISNILPVHRRSNKI